MATRCPVSILSLLLFAAATSGATGATLVVDQNDPACDDVAGMPFCTIAAALAAAEDGDTVKVETGTYFETGLVVTQDNLSLRGDDAIIDGGCAAGVVLLIDGDDVEIKGLTIQNAQQAIAASGTAGLVVRNNTIASVEIGIEFDEVEDAEIRDNVITAGDGCGKAFMPLFGILAEDGGGNDIRRNRVSGFVDTGISTDEDGDTIVSNRVWGCKDGFEIDGAGSLLEKNTAFDNTDEGFDVDGDDNVFKKNKAIGNADKGFDVSGDGNAFVRNRATLGEDDGFRIQGNENTLEKNVSRDNAQDGFQIDGAFNVLDRNTAQANGDEGIEMDGSDNTLTENVAKDNVSDGIELDGADADRNTLVGNVSKGNLGKGIDVEGDDNVILDNEAKGNASHGFDVDGTANLFEGNTSKDNAGVGYSDATGETADEVLNNYVDNDCGGNLMGPSDPEGLCD